jgi:hypothetical protein
LYQPSTGDSLSGWNIKRMAIATWTSLASFNRAPPLFERAAA